MPIRLRFEITWRETLVVVLGNIFCVGLGLLLFISCGKLGITPIGEFMQYNLKLYLLKNAESIIEDPHWQFLLRRFQFFLGIVLVPAVSFITAILCTAAQKNRKLWITYFATLPIPAFLELSASYSHLIRFKFVVSPIDFVPVASLLINAAVIYIGYIIIVYGRPLRKRQVLNAPPPSSSL